jgi:hypothetical protein
MASGTCSCFGFILRPEEASRLHHLVHTTLAEVVVEPANTRVSGGTDPRFNRREFVADCVGCPTRPWGP